MTLFISVSLKNAGPFGPGCLVSPPESPTGAPCKPKKTQIGGKSLVSARASGRRKGEPPPRRPSPPRAGQPEPRPPPPSQAARRKKKLRPEPSLPGGVLLTHRLWGGGRKPSDHAPMRCVTPRAQRRRRRRATRPPKPRRASEPGAGAAVSVTRPPVSAKSYAGGAPQSE